MCMQQYWSLEEHENCRAAGSYIGQFPFQAWNPTLGRDEAAPETNRLRRVALVSAIGQICGTGKADQSPIQERRGATGWSCIGDWSDLRYRQSRTFSADPK